MGANGSEDSVTNKPSAYILWSISFIIISCPLLHISVTFHTDGLWSSRFCWLLYSLRRRENYLHGSPRAAVHLMLWTGGLFLLALLLTKASLRLPCPFIPYINSTSPLFSSISFLLIFERKSVTLFRQLYFRQLIRRCLWSRPEGHLTSKFHLLFLFYFCLISEDVSLGT